MFAAYNDRVNQFQKEGNGKTQGNNKVNKIETYHHEQQTYYSYLGIFQVHSDIIYTQLILEAPPLHLCRLLPCGLSHTGSIECHALPQTKIS